MHAYDTVRPSGSLFFGNVCQYLGLSKWVCNMVDYHAPTPPHVPHADRLFPKKGRMGGFAGLCRPIWYGKNGYYLCLIIFAGRYFPPPLRVRNSTIPTYLRMLARYKNRSAITAQHFCIHCVGTGIRQDTFMDALSSGGGLEMSTSNPTCVEGPVGEGDKAFV